MLSLTSGLARMSNLDEKGVVWDELAKHDTAH